MICVGITAILEEVVVGVRQAQVGVMAANVEVCGVVIQFKV